MPDIPVIDMVHPMPGFPDRSKFALVQLDDDGVLCQLRSLEDPSLRFLVVSPFSFFPDLGLLLPVTLLTGGHVGVESEFSKSAALTHLCAGEDVGIGLIAGDRRQRFKDIQAVLGWEEPSITTYSQGDGATTFEYGTFAGRVDSPACAAR